MGLSINPFAKIVAAASEQIAATQASGNANPPSQVSQLEKAKLDAKVSQLAGEFGSGLNNATTGGVIDGAVSGMGKSLGSGGNVVNSIAGSDAISSLSENVGSIPGSENLPGGGASAGEISSTLSKITGGLAEGAKSIAGSISKAAGDINDLLSVHRAKNIPADGELFKTGSPISLKATSEEDWRVKISANEALFDGPIFAEIKRTGGVVFPYLPQISFSTKANYTQIDPVHNNYPFQAYKNSQVDEIQITGDFTANNEFEAAYWIAATTFFRTVTKMFFGQGSNAGNPPPVCQLNGYGASVFENVPIVVKSFSVELPNDVNYVKCTSYGTTTWVPIKSQITVQVQPIYNRANLRKFSLENFARGKMLTPSGAGYL